jgi:hypothetical protein
MSAGDVRVFGLVAPQHVIEDIAIVVPHGREIVIPADKAGRSKDLYRAINQKCIFKLPDPPAPVHQAPITHVKDDILQQRCQFLEARNRLLEEENAGLRESLRAAMSQQAQLDSILQAVKNVTVVGGYGVAPVAAAPREELADGTAPQFIPGDIAPKNAEARIDLVTTEADDSSSVSDAAARLRKMRKGG